jgi:hypothetical protein
VSSWEALLQMVEACAENGRAEKKTVAKSIAENRFFIIGQVFDFQLKSKKGWAIARLGVLGML